MKRPSKSCVKWPTLALAAFALAGCSEGASDPGAADGNAGEPAVMVVGQVYSPEDYLTYVGVFPEVPTGNVSFSTFRELGNANAYTHGGYVFVEEEGRIQRFSIGEDLQLIDGPEFGWSDFGVAEINASYTVFVSMRRAYTFAPELSVVLVWDPEAMAVTGELELDFPARPIGTESWAYDGRLVGDKVIWNVFSGDFEANTVHPAVVLAVADANSDAPVKLLEDDRCLPGGPSFLDDNGDLLIHGGAFYGYFYAYGGVPDGRTCMLRLRAGESELDQEFVLDYQELTGSYVTEPWFHVTGSKYVAQAWDPEVEFPEVPDEFWGNAALHSVLLDTEAGTMVPYPDLQDVAGIDGITRELDGISYYQLSESGYVAGGSTDVVELHPDGTRQAFQLDGFLLGLERIR